MPGSSSVLYERLIRRARLKHLHLLLTIDESRSLQRAAQAIGMSQPAATHALGELESLLGTALFERHARGMRPTPAGRALMPAVRAALRAMQDLAGTAATMHEGATGKVKVGAIGAGIGGVLVQALPAYTEANPEVFVDVLEVDPDDMLEAWEHQPLDVLLCRRPQPCPSNAAFVEVAGDRYCVVAGVGHPLAAHRGRVALDALAAARWLMQPPGSIAEREFHALWDPLQAMPPQRRVAGRSQVMLVAMLQQQALLAFCPYRLARPLLAAGLLVEIDCELGRALPPIGLLYRPADATGDTPIARFVDTLRSFGDGLRSVDDTVRSSGEGLPAPSDRIRSFGAAAGASSAPAALP